MGRGGGGGVKQWAIRESLLTVTSKYGRQFFTELRKIRVCVLCRLTLSVIAPVLGLKMIHDVLNTSTGFTQVQTLTYTTRNVSTWA